MNVTRSSWLLLAALLGVGVLMTCGVREAWAQDAAGKLKTVSVDVGDDAKMTMAVSYTHLTLPTN